MFPHSIPTRSVVPGLWSPLLILFLLCSTPAALSAQQSSFWNEKFQQAPAGEVLEKALPAEYQKGEQAAVLLRSGDYLYQDDGSLRTVSRLVYVVQNPEGVKNWSSVQVGYSPWHEEKPVVTVRITHPDGTQTWVRTEDLLEVSGSADDGNIYSDSKLLKGPFPQVREGSVVEQEIRTLTRPVLDSAGLVRYWSFSPQVPEAWNTLKIQVPKGRNLQYLTTLMGDLKPLETETADGKIFQFSLKDARPYRLPAAGLPADQLKWPSVTFSTAPDWKTLGTLYNRSVENSLAGEDLPPPAGLPAGNLSPRELTLRLLHWIDGKVRYTGLELGANSIIPVPPSKVMERGFGDCKDKALLLISFLRKKGFKAHVALVKTGPGQDVEPGVPGLDHFNHAIVYVDEDGGFFVDPTVEYNREGKLPYWDQGRWALVAGKDSPGLIRTPLAPSSGNLAVLARKVQLTDDGAAVLEESQTYTGDYEVFYRNRYAGEAPDRRKKRLEDYGSSVLLGKTVSYDVSASEDLGSPFRSRVEVEGSRAGYTEGTTAWWEFPWSEVKSWIPDLLLENAGVPRDHSYQMNIPFVVRWENTLVPPKGFALRGSPSPFRQQWGPLSLEASSESQGEGVKLTILLDSGKSLYTPEEFRQARKGLTEFFTAPPVFKVNFDHKGEILFQEGNYRGGFDAFRKLIGEEPSKGVHHLRLSTALLKMGLGDQAVLSARKAVELEPGSPKAWANLGWTLEFNALGRRFGRGWDREGAVAAFRKAVELESDAWYHRANLAILLEFDPNGFRYARREDMEAARREYESLGKELDNGELRNNYLQLLFLLGDYSALTLQGEKASRDQRNLAFFLAAAVRGGTDAGIRALDPQLEAKDRSRILALAAERLVQARMYPLAAQTYREAAKGSSDSVKLEYQADSLAGTTTASFAPGSAATPREIVYQYLAGLGRGQGTDFSHLDPLMTESYRKWGLSPGTRPFYREWGALTRSALNQGVTQETLGDLLLSRMETDLRGDADTGFHVGVRLEGNDRWDGYFLLKTPAGWKLAATDRTIGLVGRQILEFLDQGNLKAAGQWLDWFYEDRVDSRGGSDLTNPLQVFWRSGSPRDPLRIKVAAQTLSAADPGTSEDMQAASGALAAMESTGTPGDQPQAKSLRIILSDGWQHLKNYGRALEYLEPVYQSHPWESSLRNSYFSLLRQSGQRVRAKHLLEELMAGSPRDMGILRQSLYLYVTGLNFPEVEGLLTRYNPRLDASDYNNLAWLSLFKASPPQDLDLERGRKAVNMEPGNRASLHTLATLYAEMGRYEEARKLLDQGMAQGYDMDPQSEDWYVLGRVAEGYGFWEAARRAYERVEPLEDSSDLADTYFLAQRRLKGLPDAFGPQP